MRVETEFITASCNCTYNCLELTEDSILFGANHALAVYNFEERKIVKTAVFHTGRVNCVRFVKNSRRTWLVTCGADGRIVLWKHSKESDRGREAARWSLELCPYLVNKEEANVNIMICDSIQKSDSEGTVGYITSRSSIVMYNFKLGDEPTFTPKQTLDLKNSIALDLAFHKLSSGQIILAVGRDSGAVHLYYELNFEEFCALRKHEDWVRCVAFCQLENGDTLLASGGQDSFITVWRFAETNNTEYQQQFEFQSHQFQNYSVIFDSMIIGHDGWISSLEFNDEGKLLSCSSDQSIILWSNSGDIWGEETRLGSVGGEIPGGFGAKINGATICSWGFQGAIQLWQKENEVDDGWSVQPSVTGHFGAVTDMDYHPDGHFIVTTSMDQTTRVFAPWGPNCWHEISRLQIHGHDLFAVKCCGDFIVSGAEEKILRAFQPTQRFIQSLEDVSSISVDFKNAVAGATLPALGLSNQSSTSAPGHHSIESLLDDDFLRSQTLWPEVSKCYGHVYEISCIAASTTLNLIASASQSTKAQFAAIILWDGTSWTKLGDFPFHKLNVTDLEFTNDGSKLLSVSRDRSWAVWTVFKSDDNSFTMKLLTSDGFHTRALWVGTWQPDGEYFATGARDKKLVLWKLRDDGEQPHEKTAMQTFESSVSALAINEENIIAVGLESGHLIIVKYEQMATEDKRLEVLIKLDNSAAHHDTIERLRFNPKEKWQLASCGTDRLVKIFQLLPSC